MAENIVCPFCGGEDFVEGIQKSYAQITPANKVLTLKSQNVYHIICLKCGTIVRSYVKNPQELVVEKK